MLNINDENLINVKKSNAKMHFDIEEKDNFYVITLKIYDLPISEYAVVFITSNREYTAAIFKVDKNDYFKKVINIEKNKVENFNKIKIVDIYSSEIFFEYEYEKEEEFEVPLFDLTDDNKKDFLKEDVEIVKEDDNGKESAKKEISIVDKEEREENKPILDKKEEMEILEDIFDIFSKKTNNINEPKDDIDEEDETNEKKNNEFEFIENQEIENNDIKKVLNSDDIILDDILENFPIENFIDLNEDYKFYIMDEYEEKLNDVNIIYNGFVMPIIYPYMGFKNKKLENAILPNWIFGKLYEEKEIKYYVYGILGSNKDETQPFMGSTGFIYYEPSVYEGYGYWLMYISVNTGKICLL